MNNHFIFDFLGLGCFDASQISALQNAGVSGLSYDSRRCKKGDMFFCKGQRFKAEYAYAAAEKGACAIVCRAELLCDLQAVAKTYSCAVIAVENIERAMAECAAFFYGHPLEKLCTVAVTGTKGKSTTAFYINSALNEHNGFKSALLSDLACEDAPRLTTPEAIDLHKAARRALDEGCTHLVCEISSQAQKMQRTHGILFDIACFTNFGSDHISPLEHKNKREYFECKASLFSSCRTAVINTDSIEGGRILGDLPSGVRKISCSTKGKESDFWVENIKTDDHGCDFVIKSKEKSFPIITLGVGGFNAQNALVACAALSELGVDFREMMRGILKGEPRGRGEAVSTADKRVTVVVDYAHNEMSFKQMLRAAKNELEGEIVTVIFGCPGGKALCRRRQLARVCAEQADRIIICEDDSAEEGYAAIRGEMKAIFSRLLAEGVMKKNVSVSYIESREKAVKTAALRADESEEKEVILLLGKGNEQLNRAYGCDEICESDLSIAKRAIAVLNQRKHLLQRISDNAQNGKELLVLVASEAEVIDGFVYSLEKLREEGARIVAVCKTSVAKEIEKRCFLKGIHVMLQNEKEFFGCEKKALKRANGALKSGCLAIFASDFDEMRLLSLVSQSYKFESAVYLMKNQGIIFGRNMQKNICFRRAEIIKSQIGGFIGENTLSALTGATEKLAIINGQAKNALLEYATFGDFEGAVIRKTD